MASISTNLKTGRRSVQFVTANRKRLRVNLGKVPMKTAEDVCRRIEALNAANTMNQPPDNQTSLWVKRLDDKLHDRLAGVGLVRKRQSALLGPFVDGYIKLRSDAKPATKTVYGHTRRCLVKFFGANRPLREITAGQADEWRLWLADTEGLADNTVRRRCGYAKQFFKHALRAGLVEVNPFADLAAALQRSTDRQFFLTVEDSHKVLQACPDTQWRVIFALTRWGGLRCPSEVLALTWGDINWDQGRFRVTSSKTEHHEGGGSRIVPLFPEVRAELERLFAEVEGELAQKPKPSAEPIVTRYRSADQNLRTTFLKIIRRAGLVKWPNLFNNLRSTRATELKDRYPGHVCEAWLGHTEEVADRHYRQVTDDHFASAIGRSEKEAHFQAQYLAVLGEIEGALNSENPVNTREILQLLASLVVDEGLEPPTSSV